MLIGFDASQTGREKAGTGYFAAGLIEGLAAVDHDNHYLLYPSFGDGVWDGSWPTTPPPMQCARMSRGPGHRTRAALEAFWRADPIDEAQLGSPDIIHSNNFYCPVGLRRARLVYTLHDLAFLEHPEWSTDANWSTCFSGVFNASVYADTVVAVSGYSRQHFLRTFPHYPPDHIRVVHPASRFPVPSRGNFSSVRGLRPDGYWLSVATIEPRKNHVRLLDALARLKAADGSVLPLALVGARGWLVEDLERQIQSRGLSEDVRVLGYVDDAALQWLYEHCFAFVYASLFEGFGMPVLEALSCGAAVITSNTTSLPEVAGQAALSVDPYDVDSIVAAMRRLARGDVDRLSLRREALARAAQFSWASTARAIKGVYDEVGELSRQT